MRLAGMVVMASILFGDAAHAGAPSEPPGPPGARGPVDGVAKPAPTVRFGADNGAGMNVVDGRRGVRRVQAQIRYCYERVLRANPTLQGRMQLTITIDKDGKVIDVATTAFEPTVDACVVARAKRWRFAKPTQERGIYVTWIGFAPDDDGRNVGGSFGELVPTLPSNPGVVVTYGAPKITGRLDAKRAVQVVTSEIRAHEYCFASIDALTPAGIRNAQAVLSIDVDGTGAITSTTLTGLDVMLAACLHRHLQQRAFPPPADGKPAGIAIQVTFKKKAPKK